MPKKRKAYVHVGLPGSGDIIETALVRHRDALLELGVVVPPKSTDESFRAAVEVLRAHTTWGFARKEVEGQWATLYRRAAKGKATVAFSQPLLASATTEQIDLFLDGLAGFEVHVVVTDAPGVDIDDVLTRWGAAVRKPERLHVVELDGKGPQAAWKAFGKVVGFGTASLGLDGVPEPVTVRDLASIDDARREIERLTRRNECLEQQLAVVDKKRRKLKRKLEDVA
jgi:hypothetical protein